MSAKAGHQKAIAIDADRECTHWCKSKTHASRLVSAVTARVSTDSLKAFCSALCHNFAVVSDHLGRTVLHMSASCGDWRFVEWLLSTGRPEIDVKDSESGWTALHRSLFYGQLSTARVLLRNGAKSSALDRDYCSPLDLITLDRPPYISFSKSDPCDCYVWGANDNYNLGVDSENERKAPEIVNTFRRDGVSVRQVSVQKFHSLFLTNDGRVYSCGTGNGGRTGLNSEELAMTPTQMTVFTSNTSSASTSTLFCEAIASGEDHMILLVRQDRSTQVYTCGLNTYHVLGHSYPIPEYLLAPKAICPKSLKLNSNQKLGEVIGVGAGRYHSLFYTREELFTFGLNVGQIGHVKSLKERTYVTPQRVSALNFRNTGTQLQHVITSDGAIVVSTTRGDVFVLHEYQCRRVASQQFEIEQICCIGGNLDERSDVDGIHAYSRAELQILILTKSKSIFLWKGSDPVLIRCLLPFGRELSVTHICINSEAVGIVTSDGEVFMGIVVQRKSKTKRIGETHSKDKLEIVNSKNVEILDDKLVLSKTKFERKFELEILKKDEPSLKSKVANVQRVKSFVSFINPDDCHKIRLKKQPLINRAVSIFTDYKNRNFAVIQSSPKVGMLEIPDIPPSEMAANFRLLYESTDSRDTIHDCVIKVGHRSFCAHKYILASRSDYFRKRLAADPECSQLTIDTSFVSQESFEQILMFIYYNSNDLFENGRKLSWLKAKDENLDPIGKNAKKTTSKKKQNETEPLRELIESCKKLSVKWLYSWLSSGGVKLNAGNKVKLSSKSPPLPSKLSFDRHQLRKYCDIVIKSEDGVEFDCHRCVLVARLDYFRGMLCSGWVESNNNSKAIALPIHSRILDILMDYIYSDEVIKLLASDDPEFICSVLVISDQYLIPLLKQHCEYVLVNLLTLKNACELLELSYIYNAQQLRRCSLDFICINLTYFIETKAIDVLGDEAMSNLTRVYQNMISRDRHIPKYSNSPTDEEFACVNSFASDLNYAALADSYDERKQFLKQQKTRTRKISRNRQRSESTPETQSLDVGINKSDSSSHISINLESISDKDKTVINNELKAQEKENSEPSMKSDITSISKPIIKWGAIGISSVPPPISFKDIMAEEETVAQKSKPKQNLSSNLNTSPISITKAKQNENINTQEIVANNSSPKSFAAMAVSPPKPHSNPWKKIDTSMATSSTTTSSPPRLSAALFPSVDCAVSMLDIVREEQEKEQNMLSLQVAKSLDIIAIEDRAIEELLVFYNAKDNPEEYIVVERVLIDRSRIAAPVWTKRH